MREKEIRNKINEIADLLIAIKNELPDDANHMMFTLISVSCELGKFIFAYDNYYKDVK
jgi:hypothetical protein